MTVQTISLENTSCPPDMLDRRSGERKMCRVRADFQISGYVPLQVRMLDLSLEGIGLLLPIAFPLGTVGALRFQLHINGLATLVTVNVEISNNVFRRTDVRAGCWLLPIDEKTRRTLTDFLR